MKIKTKYGTINLDEKEIIKEISSDITQVVEYAIDDAVGKAFDTWDTDLWFCMYEEPAIKHVLLNGDIDEPRSLMLLVKDALVGRNEWMEMDKEYWMKASGHFRKIADYIDTVLTPERVAK